MKDITSSLKDAWEYSDGEESEVESSNKGKAPNKGNKAA